MLGRMTLGRATLGRATRTDALRTHARRMDARHWPGAHVCAGCADVALPSRSPVRSCRTLVALSSHSRHTPALYLYVVYVSLHVNSAPFM